MSNVIDWNDNYSYGAVVHLTDREYAVYALYSSVKQGIVRYFITLQAFLLKVRTSLLDRYYRASYGERVNVFGQKVANIEHYRSGDEIIVRRFSGNDGVFKIMNGKTVKIANSGGFSCISEGNVEKARKIAMELVDNDMEAKLDKKQEKQNNWELAKSTRNYGFNNQWASGLDHERG